MRVHVLSDLSVELEIDDCRILFVRSVPVAARVGDLTMRVDQPDDKYINRAINAWMGRQQGMKVDQAKLESLLTRT